MAVVQRTTRKEVRQTRRESRERIVAAATELVRRRAYAELSVDAVMREAGIGRTIFYRHFDDLADLLLSVSREAVEELFEAQRSFVAVAPGRCHGRGARARSRPRSRSTSATARCCAAWPRRLPATSRSRGGYAAMRRRFDDFAEQSLREVAGLGQTAPTNLAETVRALNLMNETYLTDAFGREPRVAPETAVQTLTEIWDAVIRR